MSKKNILEVWYHPGWNSIELHEYNACYCCPNDLVIYRSKNGRKDGWHGRTNKSSHTNKMLRCNWVRLERQVKEIGE